MNCRRSDVLLQNPEKWFLKFCQVEQIGKRSLLASVRIILSNLKIHIEISRHFHPCNWKLHEMVHGSIDDSSLQLALLHIGHSACLVDDLFVQQKNKNVKIALQQPCSGSVAGLDFKGSCGFFTNTASCCKSNEKHGQLHCI